MKLEQIIASTCRQKILLTLSKIKRTHLTRLVRMINSTYNQVRRNLEILEKEGIVKINPCGNMKIVELQTENPKTAKLLTALRALESRTDSLRIPHQNFREKSEN